MYFLSFLSFQYFLLFALILYIASSDKLARYFFTRSFPFRRFHLLPSDTSFWLIFFFLGMLIDLIAGMLTDLVLLGMIPLTAILFFFTTGSSESTLALPFSYLRFTVWAISTFNNAVFFSWGQILAFFLRTRPFVFFLFFCLIFAASS